MRFQAVVPQDFDDPARPTGGNIYDLKVLDGLRDLGWQVDVHPVTGAWPWPDDVARNRLAAVVASLPDDAVLLVDGLIASSVPEILVPATGRLRLVVLVHLPLGDEPVGHDVSDAFARERDVLTAAHEVVTTSAWTAQRVSDLYGVPARRLHVATPGVEPADPTVPSLDGRRLVCVSTVAEHKGQDILVEALALIADRAWHCSLVGLLDREPHFVARLRQRIAHTALGTRIDLVGPCHGPRLSRAYAEADLVVHPSRVEAYGMVLTEALSHGVPVITTDVGGVAEAVGVTDSGDRPGLLVRPDDSAALADALASWLDDPAVRRRLRAAAAERRAALTGWGVTSARLADALVAAG